MSAENPEGEQIEAEQELDTPKQKLRTFLPYETGQENVPVSHCSSFQQVQDTSLLCGWTWLDTRH